MKIVFLIIIMFSFPLFSQTDSLFSVTLTAIVYGFTTTYIPFRNDSIKITEGIHYLPAHEKLILFNLDYFGYRYYELMKKHNIVFIGDIDKQIRRIFGEEEVVIMSLTTGLLGRIELERREKIYLHKLDSLKRTVK